ncbi:hypothetical protein GOP47_0005109 [Adiantum capillus-veneris]|uniref:Uncharacterized protein n=1 Tax=Adiantum capillus-veneris TaxID=13818 RepID=A0A9D4ZNU8_ADICA|nr:hypothetical protein GOP47_0005109 [Adiantum capillus-veneris]
MHGQRTEDRQKEWHMWPGPLKRVSVGTEADSACLKYFTKAGRKIRVGDCALFRVDDAPFFIGLIKKLSGENGGNLKLSVNWLYRLGDINLGKGAAFEAAPNEIFYSFHEDEISAAALLHPCKVAFLQKGVELPASVSSFVCRRVYDITNKCLYWLTDRDYTDEHQAEVDTLLDRTKHEMQVTSSEGPSQRATSSPSPLKQEMVSVSLSMQGKSKKRPRTEQVLDPSKREKLMKEENDVKRECQMIFDDFANIAKKHEGLMNVSLIEQLFQVMLQECSDSGRKLVDTMSRRTLLSSIVAATEKEECLTYFVQLGGLRILNDWLQEAHKGKGDGSPRDGEVALEELLLTLIRALSKLPVDLDALKNCIVGKSVNRLRSHRNPEIQKKAKELVDTWKRRVNAEMKSSDEVKTGTSTAWPSKAATEAPGAKMRSAKSSAIVKPVTNGSIVTGDSKVIEQSTSGGKEQSTSFVLKESVGKSLIAMTHDINVPVVKKERDIFPMVKKEKDILPVVKEEKSCSSSQSQNNSQSWCSGSVKGGGSWKDEVKPIPVAPLGSKSAGTKSHGHSHSTKSHSTVTLISLQKDLVGKHKGDKLCSGSLPEKGAIEGARAELNNQRLILRLPNPARSPSHSVSGGGSLLDGSAITNKGSQPGSLVRHASESVRAAPAQPSGNIGDAKCGKSSGAGIKEESDRSYSEDKDCKPASFEHMLKELSSKDPQGNAQKKLSSNQSPPRLVLDVVQGGIDLLASVAAGEVFDTEKCCSGSIAGEARPVSTDGIRNSPIQGRMDSRHQKGEREKEGAQAICEKVTSSAQKSQLPEGSITKEPLIRAEDKVSGDGALIGETQSASLVSSAMKEATLAAVSGMEGVLCEGGQGGTNSTVRDEKENMLVGNSIATSLIGQCQTASESGLVSVDEDCEDSERQPRGCVSPKDAKGVDSSGCYGEDALEIARQVAMEAEQEVEKYRTPEVQDAKSASLSVDIPTCENAHSLSIRISSGNTDGRTDTAQVSTVVGTPGKCTSPSAGFSDRDEISLQQSGENTIGQCAEPASYSVVVPKEVSDTKEIVPVITAKEDFATSDDANVELKSSGAEKIPSEGICESKDVEWPVFDLNEGLVTDEVLQTTATNPIACTLNPAVPCSEPLSGPVVQASSLATPVAVVAATKGAFIPPSNIAQIKGELGWKGSAATSAFRPAEPRRMAETAQPSCEASTSKCASTEVTNQSGKQPRFLDIDLNIADERGLEDSFPVSTFPGLSVSESLTDNALVASRPELDLNRMDGNDEHMSPSLLISRGTAVLTARASVPPLAAPRVMLDFDLNDGLGIEEEAPSQHRNLESSGVSVAGGIRQNTDIPIVAPWYSAASSTPSAMMMPTFPTSSRSESSYPAGAGPGSKSMMTMGHTFGSFNSDGYRGAAVSSATVPYAGSVPSSFSYPGFPFGAGFPLTSASYNMGSPLNSSASSPPFLTAGPSQLVGAGAVLSSYGRPYLMGSMRDIPGLDSSATWVRPNLDLNTGPEVGADFDARESIRPGIGLSQLSYQQAASLGGSLKRKEPDGSFDPFRTGFKQTAWR